MKRFSIIVSLLFIVSSLFSQATDTITYPFDNASGFTIFGIQDEGGFVTGTNSITADVGQYFEFGQGQVTGAFFWFGAKEVVGTSDTFTVSVYATGNDSLPMGLPLASVELATTDIDTPPGIQGFGDFQYIPFPSAPTVTGGFVVSVEVNSASSDDTIAVVSNADGDGFGLRRSVMRAANNQWFKLADIWGGAGGALDVDLIILPEVSEQFFSSATVNNDEACPGDIRTLNANISGGSGNYSISWSPTAPPNNIFSPFNEITDVEVGQTTTFTCTVIDNATNDTIVSSVTITVNAITVDVNDATLGCGGSVTLTATPGGNLNQASFLWSDGNQGLNNSVSQPGAYTVTASNGFGCQDSATAVVTLTGTSQSVDFTFNTGQPGNIGCVGQSIDFTNASSSTTGWDWTWEFNDANSTTSTAENPTFPGYASAGTYNVTLTADSGACEVSKTRQITVTVCVGIEEASVLNQYIDIYPNPTSGVFNINFKELEGEEGVMEIFDINGKTIFSQDLSITGDMSKSIDLNDQADGIYVVKIEMKDEVLVRKLNLSR